MLLLKCVCTIQQKVVVPNVFLEYIYVLSIYSHTSVGVGRETYLHVSMLHGRVNLILHVLYIWFDGSDNTATMASMFAVFC